MPAIVFISKLLKKKVFNIKPILLCFKINSDLLNLHVCKSQPCCAGFSTSIPGVHPSDMLHLTPEYLGLVAFIALLLILIE